MQIDMQDARRGESKMSRFLYYFGSLIVIGAMGWFMNSTWDAFGGAGLFGIAVLYAALFVITASRIRDKATTLCGLLIVMAVCMTPLGVYGLQKWSHLWLFNEPGSYRNFYVYVRSGWFAMEVTTIAAALLSLRYARIPFAMAPVAFTLWYMSMDVTPIFYGPDYTWMARRLMSLGFGLAMLIGAFLIDRRREIDWAKWLYIFGALTFWAGLSALLSDSELNKLFYCLINVFMMVVGIILERKVFLIFGSLGVFGYLGYLSWTIFKNSVMFPFALTAIGLFIVCAGWMYGKKHAQIKAFLMSALPKAIIVRLPNSD